MLPVKCLIFTNESSWVWMIFVFNIGNGFVYSGKLIRFFSVLSHHWWASSDDNINIWICSILKLYFRGSMFQPTVVHTKSNYRNFDDYLVDYLLNFFGLLDPKMRHHNWLRVCLKNRRQSLSYSKVNNERILFIPIRSEMI